MKLIPISGKQMCKLVEKLGFQKVHHVGSHARYAHPDGRKTTIPVHANEDLGKGLLLEILQQIKIDREEYDRLRRKV
ncbi:type II toxin-antitoxin system HicA family toxin [Candidatus Woesearchaeota archaeon]|nr:type II toxin-antitoxin system HicA family toxin [Candidatus Woesearchaeota archaeon]